MQFEPRNRVAHLPIAHNQFQQNKLVKQDASPHVGQRNARHDDQGSHHIPFRPSFEDLGHILDILQYKLKAPYEPIGIRRLFSLAIVYFALQKRIKGIVEVW